MGEKSVKQGKSALIEVVERRTFLKVLGSAGPAMAIGACSPVPPEKIIPFVIPPEDVIPGVATWYASVCGECPAGCGTLVRTRVEEVSITSRNTQGVMLIRLGKEERLVKTVRVDEPEDTGAPEAVEPDEQDNGAQEPGTDDTSL